MNGDRAGRIATSDEAGPHGGRIGTVAIVDDHGLLAETLAELLRLSGVQARAVMAGDRDELIEAILVDEPDAVLLDYHLGETIGTAVPIVRALVRRGIAVVVLTGDASGLTAASCLEAGAAGILGKGASIGEVLDALSRAAAGASLVDEQRRHQLVADLRLERAKRRKELQRFAELTPREADVLRLICSGLAAAEVAEMSYVSLATIRSQIRSILVKLGVTSQLAAVAEAYRSGWVARPTANSSLLPMAAGR